MRLLERECKEILSRHGIGIPRGVVARSSDEAVRAVTELGGRAVLKIQIPRGRRGKAGGIVPVGSEEDAEREAERLLSSVFHGFRSESLLVEEFISAERELYLGAVIDRSKRTMTFLSSVHGGMEVEEMAKEHPESILKVPIDPLLGLMPHSVRALASNAVPEDGSIRRELEKIALAMWRIARDLDATLIELNPLAITGDNRVVALDARIEVDDSALFRHPDLSKRVFAINERERRAREEGIAYVELEGSVGTVANGAGLAMTTMDLVERFGGKPANFCDVGGGASSDRVRSALQLVASNPNVKVLLLNVLGGITSCVEVATGVVEAMRSGRIGAPLIVRLSGNLAEEGRKILEEGGIRSVEDAEEAVRLAVNAASGG